MTPGNRSTNASAWPPERLALWIAVAALALAWDAWHWRDWRNSFYPPPGAFADFSQEWLSARNYLTGRPVYSPQFEALIDHTGYRTDDIVPWNGHPPVAVLLTLPFGRLSYPEAHCAWALLTVILFLSALTLAAGQRQKPFRWQHLLPLIALLAVCCPLQTQIQLGQLTGVLVFLVVAAWWADRRERQCLAGACIGLAAAIKLFPAFLFLYWLMQRKWRALIAGLITFVSLNAVAAVLFGTEAFTTYREVIIPWVGQYRRARLNMSMTAFWLRLFNPEYYPDSSWANSPQLANVLIWTSQAAVAILTAVRCRQARTRADRDRALGLAVIGMLLVSPITWDHNYLFLLMPLAVEGIVPGSRPARVAFFICLIALWVPMFWFLVLPMGLKVLIVWNTQRRVLPPTRPWQALVGFGVPTYALMILFGLVWGSFRDSAAPEPADGR
jgi:Glycosyltransferase family 87